MPVCEPQALEIAAQLLPRHGVQGTQRLVHQDQRRVVDKSSAKGGALLHPARQLIGPAAAEGTEPDRAQQLLRAVDIARPRQAAQVDLQQHVAQHVAPVDQDVTLEDDADLGLRAGDGPVGEPDLAAGAGEQPGDHHQQRALATTRGADQRHEGTGLDPKVERAERMHRRRADAEGLGRSQDVDGDGHAPISSPAG